MLDAEINRIVANNIAQTCNELMEKTRPFPSEKLEECASSIYDAMQNLGELYRALQDYKKGNEQSLINLK